MFTSTVSLHLAQHYYYCKAIMQESWTCPPLVVRMELCNDIHWLCYNCKPLEICQITTKCRPLSNTTQVSWCQKKKIHSLMPSLCGSCTTLTISISSSPQKPCTVVEPGSRFLQSHSKFCQAYLYLYPPLQNHAFLTQSLLPVLTRSQLII